MNKDNWHYIRGRWPVEQHDGMRHWVKTQMDRDLCNSSMEIPSSVPKSYLDHQFSFARAEDLALFLLTWPGIQIEHIDFYMWYGIDRD